LKSQIVISSWGGAKYEPHAFAELIAELVQQQVQQQNKKAFKF